MQVLLFAGIQKMNEHPRLEDIFRQIKCPKEFQDTVDKILTVEIEKLLQKKRNSVFLEQEELMIFLLR